MYVCMYVFMYVCMYVAKDTLVDLGALLRPSSPDPNQLLLRAKYVHTYLPTYLPNLPTYLSTYLPTYLPIHPIYRPIDSNVASKTLAKEKRPIRQKSASPAVTVGDSDMMGWKAMGHW